MTIHKVRSLKIFDFEITFALCIGKYEIFVGSVRFSADPPLSERNLWMTPMGIFFICSWYIMNTVSL